MKELTVKEKQEISLDILKAIHIICEDNGITYSVIGGTLLGAVRHKGFIPWDDDIDIMMPRGDYERFCRLFIHSDKYKVLSTQNDKSCKIAYAKVCDIKDTVVIDQAWTSEKVGLWVDVFPFDGAENDYDAFKSRYARIKKIWTSLFYNRAIAGKTSKANNAKLNIAIRCLSLLHLSRLNDFLARVKIRRINESAQKVPYGTTDFVSQFAFLEPGPKEYFAYGAFQDRELMRFEDTEVYGISGFEHYLTRFYGNYMQLPPEKDRVPKHEDSRIVWR